MVVLSIEGVPGMLDDGVSSLPLSKWLAGVDVLPILDSPRTSLRMSSTFGFEGVEGPLPTKASQSYSVSSASGTHIRWCEPSVSLCSLSFSAYFAQLCEFRAFSLDFRPPFVCCGHDYAALLSTLKAGVTRSRRCCLRLL